MGRTFAGKCTIKPDSMEYQIIFTNGIYCGTMESHMFSRLYNQLSAGFNMDAELILILKAILLEIRPSSIKEQTLEDLINLKSKINKLHPTKDINNYQNRIIDFIV